MSEEYRSPGAGEGGGTQLEFQRRGWVPLGWALVAFALLVLVLQAGCATSTPLGGRMRGASLRYRPLSPAVRPEAKRRAGEDLEAANLRRAATLPWTDGGQCVVQESSEPWPVLAERCFHALDHERVRFRDTTGRCAVASAGAAAMGVGLCVLAAPQLVVGAIIVTGVVVVGFAIHEALEAYEKRGRPQVRPPPTLPVPERLPVPETKPVPQEPRKKRRPKPEPAGEDWPPPLPPEPLDRERDRKCEAIPVPHTGGNKAHNTCADWYPPNRWPGMDARVDGRNFDALQVGVRVLWEIKVEHFDGYNDFLRKITVEREIEELTEFRDIAVACGYAFKVGVISEAHKAALLKEDRNFDIVVTECK
jgi:hypothetical protein